MVTIYVSHPNVRAFLPEVLDADASTVHVCGAGREMAWAAEFAVLLEARFGYRRVGLSLEHYADEGAVVPVLYVYLMRDDPSTPWAAGNVEGGAREWLS